jgi:hypothetical protein
LLVIALSFLLDVKPACAGRETRAVARWQRAERLICKRLCETTDAGWNCGAAQRWTIRPSASVWSEIRASVSAKEDFEEIDEDEDDANWEDHHVPIGRQEMEDIDREYAEKEQAAREQRAREGRLLRVHGLRQTALGIGVASRLAARLQVKLERVEHRIVDPLVRQEVREH